MKKILVLIFSLIAISAYSQEQTHETLFGSDDVRFGFFGGPEMKITNINNQTGLLIGGRGALLINSTFSIGLGGYGLVTSHEVPDFKIIPNRGYDSSAYTRVGYGGLTLGVTVEPAKIVHITAGLLIGAGGAAYTSSYTYDWGDSDDNHHYTTFERSTFFIAEPSIGAELNILKFMRMELSASYRFISGLDLSNTSNKDLSGFSGNLIFKFGKF
jgi:hypothetical protein